MPTDILTEADKKTICEAAEKILREAKGRIWVKRLWGMIKEANKELENLHQGQYHFLANVIKPLLMDWQQKNSSTISCIQTKTTKNGTPTGTYFWYREGKEGIPDESTLQRENATGIGAGNAKNQLIRRILWHFARGGMTPKKWKETLTFFDDRCVYCGKPNNKQNKLELDHAIPANKAHLGTNQHGNIVPACKKCNREKGKKHYEDYCDCKEPKNPQAKEKIATWQAQCGYVPLAKNPKTAEAITKLLEEACNEIDELANRYIELIKKEK